MHQLESLIAYYIRDHTLVPHFTLRHELLVASPIQNVFFISTLCISSTVASPMDRSQLPAGGHPRPSQTRAGGPLDGSRSLAPAGSLPALARRPLVPAGVLPRSAAGAGPRLSRPLLDLRRSPPLDLASSCAHASGSRRPPPSPDFIDLHFLCIDEVLICMLHDQFQLRFYEPKG